MASGFLRPVHVLVLATAARGDVYRGETFDYHLPGRSRHVSEAVYLLETYGYVSLSMSGEVVATSAGLLYLDRRLTASAGSSTVNV